MHLHSNPTLFKCSYLVALVVHPGIECLAFLFSVADLLAGVCWSQDSTVHDCNGQRCLHSRTGYLHSDNFYSEDDDSRL